MLSVILLALFSILPSCGGGGGGGGGPLYSNATLTGIWMAKSTVGSDTIIDSFKFDGNGHMVESYILNPGALPSPYNVQADGSFTCDITFAYDPTITVTGKLTSATEAIVTSSTYSVSGTTMTGNLRKITDLGACKGAWNGTLSGGHTKSFTIDVDNTGTITGGSGFTGPLGGKLFCVSSDSTGLLTTGETNELSRIQFHSGTVVSGATVTISGNYEINGPVGTYTLVRTSSPTSLIVKGTSGNDVNMNGTWTAPCFYDAQYQEDTLDTLTFNGGSFTFISKLWLASPISNCTQTAAPAMIGNISGSVTKGATGTAIWMSGKTPASPPAGIPANAQATQTTIVFNSATVTLQSDAFVNDYNTNIVCGGGWVKNMPKDVLNCTDIIISTTEQDYWVIDDSAPQLKWYANDDSVAWHVDINSVMTK